uniref:Uncharacterized protein n=1 Tax=Plectus sambesii TaxID=2011161 RepID=A0A914VNM9_9BILA
MTNYPAPIYELLLNTTDDQSQKAKMVPIGVGEPFKMQCIVIGEYHENHDLRWSKDGNELVTSESMKVADSETSAGGSLSKSIIVTSFNVDNHTGAYECSVKRKDDSYQKGTMRLQRKPGNSQIGDGFTTCQKERDGMCLNGGICIMQKASGSISCLCPNSNGPKCERLFEESAPIARSDLHGTQAALWIMPMIIIALLVLVFLCSRQNKKLKSEIKKLRKFSCPDPASTPFHNGSDQHDFELLAVQQTLTEQDEENCQNGESTQFSRDGSTSTTPSAVREATSSQDLSNQTKSVSLTPHNDIYKAPDKK